MESHASVAQYIGCLNPTGVCREGEGSAAPTEAQAHPPDQASSAPHRLHLERLCRLGDACSELQGFVDSSWQHSSLYRAALAQGISGESYCGGSSTGFMV